jgi:hypothetical protein
MYPFQNWYITSLKGIMMEMNLNTSENKEASTHAASKAPMHAFEQECVRILRCTALALANSPGGLIFAAGTRPWLDALSTPTGA